jgi:hypothetical protein
VSVKLQIFYPELQQLIKKPDNFAVEGKTVGECLSDLVKRYPAAEKLLFNQQGQLLKQVYVYVNSEGFNKAEFTQPVAEKDQLIIAVLITGG